MGDIIKDVGWLISNFGVVAGLLIILILALCWISYRIIMHIIKQSNDILKIAMDMNEKWQKAIETHTEQAKEFHTQVNQAHEYQRKEQRIVFREIKFYFF